MVWVLIFALFGAMFIVLRNFLHQTVRV